MGVSVNGGTLRSIQVLRGIAALAVVIRHAASTSAKHGIYFPFLTNRDVGEWGVDIFFVISGFIMTFITADHRGRLGDTWRFWVRRIFRIVPMYWLVSGLVLAIAVFQPKWTDYTPTPAHVMASFFFIPWVDVRGVNAPLLRVGWTLDFEMYFYLMFGLLLLVPRTVWWLTVWVLCAVLIGVATQPASALGQMLTSPLISEFLIGVCIGIAYLKGIRVPTNLAMVSAILAVLAIIVLDTFGFRTIRVIDFGVPAAILVGSVLSLELSKTISFSASGPFLLGEWSYSIYLTHVLTLAACGRIAAATHLPRLLSGSVVFVVGIAAAVGVGAVAYRFLEHPMHQFVSRAFPMRRVTTV